MDDVQLRRMLAEATADEPPLGAVVERAVHAGIRLRRRRRISALASSMAAVAVASLLPTTLVRGLIPSLGHAAASAPLPATSRADTSGPLAPSGGQLFVATQLGMFTVALPSGTAGPLLTDNRDPMNQYFLPYRGTVYDYDAAAQELNVFDAATGKRGKPIALGKTSYTAPYGTDPMAITPDGATLYLPDQAADTVIPVHTATASAGKPIRVGAAPVSIVMSPDGSTAWVLGRTGTVTAIRTATGKAGKPISLGTPGSAQFESDLIPDPITISPDGSTVYVLYYGMDLLIPVHTATGTVGRPIKLGDSQAGPDQVVFSPDGATAYVADGDSVVPVQVRPGKVGAPIKAAATSIAIAPDGTTLYAMGGETLTRVSVVAGRARAQVPRMGQPLLSLAMSPDGSTVYVSRNHAIVVVSAAAARQQRLIPLPVSQYAYVIEFSR